MLKSSRSILYNVKVMLDLLFLNPLVFLIAASALAMVVAVHEFAHAWTAVRLGDPTPKLQKRVTLNPLSHLDPLGTLMLIIAGFGWGRPVQFDPYNLSSPKKDAALISLAGPASNLMVASSLSLIARFISLDGNVMLMAIRSPESLVGTMPWVDFFLVVFISISLWFSIVLAIFNLIPIHPLDGGKILSAILPHKESVQYDVFMNRYGIFLILFLVLPIFGPTPPALRIIQPIIGFFARIYFP